MFRKNFPFYPQLDTKDCGPACLRMIGKHYGRSFSLDYLRQISFITRQGVSLASISEAAEQIGFRTLAAEIPFEALQAKVPLPCIVHWEHNHFVVVYEITSNNVLVADPGLGLVRYPHHEFIQKWQLPSKPGTGFTLLFEPTPLLYETDDQSGEEITFSFLLSYTGQHRKLLVQLFIGLLLGTILSLIFPFLTQSIVDVGIQTQNIHLIYIICFAQLMLFLGRTAIDFIRSRVLLLIGSRISISLFSDYLLKLMKLPIPFFETRNIGDNMQRMIDHQRIESFLTSSLIDAVFSILNLCVFGMVLLLYSSKIFLVFLVASIIGLAWTWLFLNKRQKMDHKRFGQYAENQNTLVEIITGMQEIKLTGSEKEKRWQWEELQAKTYDLNLKTLYLDQSIQGGILFFNELKNIIISFIAAMQVISGEITLGMMLAVTYITGQLNNPVLQLLQFMKQAQDARLSLARFYQVHQKKDEDYNAVSRNFPSIDADIHLHQVSFRYGGASDQYVLQDLNFSIPKGKVTAIVGMSGSGKTTLLKLLLKFYPPTQGEIRLGHTSLENINSRQWRKRCGVVMQDGYIFSDTIARNIALGCGTVEPEKLQYAARIANIDTFIEDLPLGYNTRIGSDGAGLSEGQKQRILIARVAYRNPEFIVFDEATNSLDANNERTIIENLNSFFKGKTVVIVAHRLSTVKDAHQIIVIDKSRVLETGTHTELIAQKSAYFHLVKNQLELGT